MSESMIDLSKQVASEANILMDNARDCDARYWRAHSPSAFISMVENRLHINRADAVSLYRAWEKNWIESNKKEE